MFALALAACLCLCAHSLPPDKVNANHIIRTRSIDLTDAQLLKTESRLKLGLYPDAYLLDIEPYLEDGVFKGYLRINVTFGDSLDEITLHSASNLNILRTEVTVPSASDPMGYETIPIAQVVKDLRKPLLSIQLEKAIPSKTTAWINIMYNGSMDVSNSYGIFKRTYTEKEEERIVVAAHLRPNFARRLFPCFDQPFYKAPLQLTIVRPRNMVALSNTEVVKTENITGEPGAVRDHFQVTPLMSTFSFGFVIADLEQLPDARIYNDKHGNSITIRVWARPEYLQALEGLYEKLLWVLGEAADVWEMQLPLSKLDIVALPNYQGVKPADSWGLIMFKESDLSNKGYLQLAQEIMYQWCGALVSPFWWSDAYINKALVNYLAAEITFKINNGSEMEGKWPMTVLYSIYYEFSKRFPHSRITGMKQETASTKIELIFRMLNFTLGEATFKKGMRAFIKATKFKGFSNHDIWHALTDSAIADGKLPHNYKIQNIADSWIDKDRVPLVTAERNYDNNTVTLTQKLYLRERPHDVHDAELQTWWVPIVLVKGDNLNFSNSTPAVWMECQKEVKLKKMPSKDHFIIVNPEEIGPFPVNYDSENWNLLLKYLQSEHRELIPELTRAKLLHDAWNLAYAGELSFATAFNMTLFLKNERNHLVWDPVFTMIDHLGNHICECIQPKFQAYVRKLLSPLYEELEKDKKEDEESWRTNLRSLMKTFLSQAGYAPCIQDAQRHYAKWMQAENPDEGNPIANQYICPVFKWGTIKEWEFGLQRVINFPYSRQQSERTYLLKNLASCPNDESKIVRLLNVTVLEGNRNFTDNDLLLIFSMLSSGPPTGYTALFHFLSNNWNVIREKLVNKTKIWDRMIMAATFKFKTQEGLDLVNKFYLEHKMELATAERIVDRAIKNIKEEAKWSADNLPVIEQWLDVFLASSNVKDDKFVKNKGI